MDVIHDMQEVMEMEVKGDIGVMKELQMVGIQNMRFQQCVLTMSKYGKHMALLKRWKIRCDPTAIADFPIVCDMMRSV